MKLGLKIARFIDGTTMYKMVIGGLGALVLYAFALSMLGHLGFGISALFISFLTVFIACIGLNVVLAKIFKAPLNHEPAIITALILFFLISPESSLNEVYVIGLAGLIAMLSKYVVALGKRHIFNPAAFGAFVVATFSLTEPIWWIGGIFFFVPMAIVGALVVYKIRRFALFWSFYIVGFFTFAYELVTFGVPFDEVISTYLFSWPALFLGTIMLTEPLTTPGEKKQQIVYGAFVGFLSNTALFSAVYVMTPELALLIANLLVLPFLLKVRLRLKLIEKKEIAHDTWEFVFERPSYFSFKAGQYLEWTLPHKADKRGVRRYFTIASAPEEDTLRLGVKSSPEGSSFKRELLEMKQGDMIFATQCSGDFLLPKDPNQKMAFIAGGIGITPFRSMVASIYKKNEERDVVLFYANRTPQDIAYSDIFESASLKTINLISEEETAREGDETGYIDKQMLERTMPDYLDRTFYLSGPHAMVVAYKKMLKQAGVKSRNIKTDYFPGLA